MSIENETFLPKQLTASIGVIPNQVHAKEMKKILSNAERYLPFLREKDASDKQISNFGTSSLCISGKIAHALNFKPHKPLINSLYGLFL